MNKNIGIIVGIIIIILIIGGVYTSKTDKDNESMIGGNMEGEKMMEEGVETMGNDTMMENPEETMMNNEGVMMEAGMYETYAPEKISQAENKNVVLFFRASWCPTCRTLDADIKTNLSLIPSDLVILDVDYDNSSNLKKKYGITYQHTLVQIDKDGNLIKKWSGSPTLTALVAEIQ